MVKFLKRNKGDKKSLLGRKRFFGKKEDRSDSVDGRNRFSRKSKEDIVELNEAAPEITLEPLEEDDTNLNVTIVTEESTPPVTPLKFEEEGSISDTISDLSASIVPCLPNSGAREKPPSPAEKMISTIATTNNQHHGNSNPSSRVSSPNEQSGTFTDHRGASQNTGLTNETQQTASTGGFSLSDFVDSACVMPWSQSPTRDDTTAGKDSHGPSWGMAPSADDDEVRMATGGRSLDYTAPSAGDTLPSVAEESVTITSTIDDTLPTNPNTASMAEERAPAYVSGDDDEEDDEDDEEGEEEQEGYELVLDSNTEEYVSKKPNVWKRMKIAKAKSPTPSVIESEKDEKYRAAFGEPPSLSKRSGSFISKLSLNRSKTPDVTQTTETDTAGQKPQMINLADEVLNPEDLVDKQGEQVAHAQEESKKDDTTEDELKKDTVSPSASMSRSRSWNIASAIKRSISGDHPRKVTSESGAGDEAGASYGLLNLLSGSPSRKAEKPEGTKPPKPVWKAAVDPNTGATYYYHRVTRQTTWTKPPGFDQQRLPKQIGASQNMSAEHQKRVEEGVEVPSNAGNTSILRNSSGQSDGARPYTKKQEHIRELLLDMSPPDPASVDKIIDEYRGREDELIDQLNEIVDSQPFDEPIEKAENNGGRPDVIDEDEYEMKKQGSFRLPLSTKSRSLKNRVMTASTNFTGRSNTTGRSNFSGNSRQTLKTGNISGARNSAKLYPVISDLSRSSIDRPASAQGRPPLPGKKADPIEQSSVEADKTPTPQKPEMSRKKYRQSREAEQSSPVKVVKAPRNRELLVEEYSSKSRYGLRAEKYSGKALSGRRRPFREPRMPFAQQAPSDKETTDEEASGMEHESFATDSVSGLSASDAGFNTRKDEFDAAARSALDDAIRNQDWELAATVTDEMRGEHLHASDFTDDATPEEWTQSSLDKFISDNDWDAVARYIASMRDKNSETNPEVAHPPSNYSGGPARKRFGARSQLQHDLERNELEQSSSWESGTSFESEFYSTGSSDQSPAESPRRAVRDDSRKNFAC